VNDDGLSGDRRWKGRRREKTQRPTGRTSRRGEIKMKSGIIRVWERIKQIIKKNSVDIVKRVGGKHMKEVPGKKSNRRKHRKKVRKV